MTSVSISRLKARLSEYVKLVRSGQEVLITDRGEAVARIVPLDPARWMDARATELVDSGLAKAPLSPLPKDFWKRPRPPDPQSSVLDALLEERAEGR